MLTLYRKRLIPEECILLKDDIILYKSNNLLLTSWNTLKPKTTLAKGYSLYVLDKGYKISKFIDSNDNFICWYCDIIQHDYDEENETYVFTDLLTDVLVYENGFVKVVDLEELSMAHKDGLITTQELYSSLDKTNSLLQEIYSGEFKQYTDFIENNIY